MSELSGKSCLITGASRGIGAAAARHFGELGARVTLLARSRRTIQEIADEIVKAGGHAIAVGADVASYADVEAAVAKAVEAHGGLDVLVNNAGLIEPIARLAESDPDEWTKVADVNYKGVYFGLRAALPVMLKSGGGTVVNVSSGAATSALEGWSHYCSSKAAALSLTACAHKEYGAEGIRVLGISPGTVRTDMQVAIKASGINPVSRLDPSVHIPAEWVAKAIAWLCTEASDDWLGRDFPLRSKEGRAAVGLTAD
ncbi:SDR family NAD(P)-dependent oxidoreductase [Minwuia thermotolerans]|uniref:Short-chain dehydrogenase n=1 Tax=Minwuia thermotolerans TaxID=2056226 RepID=A0A2M9FVF8_9PROT|nr:SDR family oxidoreductase [Minwuia thermotolerans]PJK27458.1 short-chain dehydrogenase [Minwuia thermotolerans]